MTTMKIDYWTGMFRCGGFEVGGQINVEVTAEERKYLESLKGLDCDDFTEKLHADNNDLYERIYDLAEEALNRESAEDSIGDYDFSDEEFDGWSYEQKLQYVIDDSEASLADMCTLLFELPSDISDIK